ncbi:hypothetical protein SAMN05518672_10391 [Chitinophaga sp. CF118]|uniref:hypothetical protein n=1 Tax=Chitinophaga sp. CF118 TaxID=1884367 RepID=UPI0008E9EC6A|nr:hypothetical protein [Chitinophaga sp. CF118]SFD75717.1 hypothetical protein SAMN05518672_10391 [Chitinophaga sp. CF118]
MTPISPEKLIEIGFSFLEGKKYFKIEVGTSSYGVVPQGGVWLFSPLPMQFASLENVMTIEDVDKSIFRETGKHLMNA